MKLDVLTRECVEKIRLDRNVDLSPWRTPYMLTEEMQDDFYDNVVCNRDSKSRYYAILIGGNKPAYGRAVAEYGDGYRTPIEFVGMAGLTNISWENGRAEIALHILKEYKGKGYGKQALKLLLDEAFLNLRLETVDGEVYHCANRGFWEKMVYYFDGYMTDLMGRKMWRGKLYNSTYFAFSRGIYENIGNSGTSG